MDLYHIWMDLKPGVKDVDFCRDLARFLEHLKTEERIQSFRISRRKLGFGPPSLPEFHVTIEVTDLAQLDRAFGTLATRAGVQEGLHAAVNQNVVNFQAALYRDFPDAVRVEGEERF